MLRAGPILAALTVAAFAAGIDAEARVACPPAGARLADRDGSSAVYWREGDVLLCRGAQRTAVTHRENGDVANEPPAIDLAGGRVVGFAASINDAPGSDFIVAVENVGADQPVLYSASNRGDGITSLRVLSDGSVAWIECTKPGASLLYRGEVRCGNSTRAVFRHRASDGRRARPELLAFSPRIKAYSLRLDGTRLSWVQAGGRRSADLR